MTTPTRDTLLALLNDLDPTPHDLISQLNKNSQATIQRWMARPREQWDKYHGESGEDIYNHLHPNGKQHDPVIANSNCA